MSPHFQFLLAYREEILSIGLEALAALTTVLLQYGAPWRRRRAEQDEEKEEEEEDEEEERAEPALGNRPGVNLSVAACTVASILGLTSMLWQHIAAVALTTTADSMSYGSVSSHVGPTAMALGWVGVICLLIANIGMIIMKLSMRVLDSLVDDED